MTSLFARLRELWVRLPFSRSATGIRPLPQTLQASNERLETILAQAVDAIITLDERGRVESFNRAAEHIFGYQAEEIIGQEVGLLISREHHPDHQEALLRSITDSQRRLAFRNRELFARRRDGTPFPVELSAGEARLEERRLFIGIVRDISERKLAQQALAESEARKSTILQSALDCIISMDQRGRIVEFNPAAEKAFGYRRHQVLGRELADVLIPPHLREAHRRGLDHYMNTGEGPVLGRRIEVEALHARGHTFPVELAITPVKLESGTLFTAYMRDITERRRHEEALRESEQRYRMVVDNVKEVIFLTNAQGHWTFLNPAWEEITGFSTKESLGQPFLNYVHPEDRDYNARLFKPLIERRKDYCRHEIRYITRDGGFRWLEVFARLTLDDEDNIIGTSGTLTDVTQRRQVEDEVRRQQQLTATILDTLPMNIYLKDAEGRFVLFNDTACRTTGIDRPEAIGKTDFDIFPARVAARIRAHDDEVRSRGVSILREERVATSYKDQYLLTGKSLIGNTPGQEPLLLTFSLDITDRKKAEQALLQAKEAAEAANRAKSDFLANMSHEIRTPMNAIIGMADLALDTELNDEQREYLSLVKSSGDALLGIINEILDFSKIESGQLHIEYIPFRLRPALKETLRTLALKAFDKGLELVYEVEPHTEDALLGDPGRLRQLLVNLVGNAIKFTERGEILVTVKVSEADTESTCLHFAVRDTGIGISEDKQQSIFDPFAQADSSTTRRFGGTGLGLTICKRLTEMMGGRLWLESEVGLGSTFHFILPFRRQQQPEAIQVIPLELKGLPVLVVDDNASNRRLLVHTLTGLGMAPDQAGGGEEGLEALERGQRDGRPFPLVLLDAAMPNLDGFQVAERIAARPAEQRPTVVMLTSSGNRGDADRCRELGIQAYLTKPVDTGELREAIGTALQRSALPGQAPRKQRPITRHTLRENRRPLKVLLAEDNKVNQKLAVRILEKNGHRVTVANDGAEAVERWSREPFDVILMDVQMPNMDGFTATREIRSREGAGSAIPIVAMTAHAMEGDRERCLEHGMDDYISKPIKVERLLEILDGIPPGEPDESTGQKDAAGPPEPEQPAPVPQAVPPLPPVPATGLIDRTTLLEQMDHDPLLLEKVLSLFLDCTPGQLEALDKAIRTGDRAARSREAATLRGLLATLGAQRAEAAALAVERADADQAAAMLERLREEMARLKPELQALLAQQREIQQRWMAGGDG